MRIGRMGQEKDKLNQNEKNKKNINDKLTDN